MDGGGGDRKRWKKGWMEGGMIKYMKGERERRRRERGMNGRSECMRDGRQRGMKEGNGRKGDEWREEVRHR